MVSSFVRHRIYTTNIDDLIQKIYAKSSIQLLDTIVCPASPRERDTHFSPVQAVHLHGFVGDLDKGITFTLGDFAQQQAKPNPWYEELLDDLFYRPVLFVGSLVEESPFHHYLALRDQRLRSTPEYRPKSFLV